MPQKMPKKKKNAHTESTLEDYIEFLKNLNLLALGLTECSAKLDRSLYFDTVAESKSAVKNISARYGLATRGKNFVDVRGRFELKVTNGKGQNCLLLNCIFDAHFHYSGAFVLELAERFAKSDARLVLWPYFRQFVSDSTARMAIPPVTVPLATRPRAESGG